MSVFCDNKAILCAGVAGFLGAGVIGYVIGKRSSNPGLSTKPQFNAKSYYKTEDKTNPSTDYVLKHALREPEPLRQLREETLQYAIGARMLSAPEEDQLFRVLLPLLNAKKVIEIGVFTGYNTLNMALSIPDDGKVVACDITDEHVNAVGKSIFKEAGVENKIDLRIQHAGLTLDELLANGEASTFDFVFIDADKTSYDEYYEKSLLLLRKGGMVAIDNVLWSGKVTGDPSKMDDETKALHKLNMKLHKDSRVNMALLPFADGVTIATKN